jgi:glycerol-3-phosphate dehydrogenase
MTRRISANIAETVFDVIIIGAGINGAGIARDAAMRGLTVLLLDKGDIGGGTSSWSTRLIHGGLRYLEHGELGLVRESLRERATLMRIAPHLVRALPIFIPIYKGARRGLWTMRAGMWAYDILSFNKNLPRHQMLSRDEALQHVPGLEPRNLTGGALYYDAQVEFAERLVLENVLSAIQHGAVVATYSQVNNFVFESDAARGVAFVDELDGRSHSASAKVVVNAAGPWVDQILAASGVSRQPLIGGTRGSHIIVAPFPGAPATAIYVEAKTDGRPFFIIPWNNNYLIGTTDIRHQGDLDEVHIVDCEIQYLLSETNRVVPTAKLDRSKILYTYSGVRPLPFTSGKDEQSITRRHFIRQHPRLENLLSIVGGKLTTYRSLAEESVDLIFRKLNKQSPTCVTSQTPLPGAESNDRVLPEPTPNRLARVYGVRSSAILELIQSEPELAEIFDAETGAIGAEVVHAFKHELSQTLTDCLLRRTMVGLNSTCGLKAVERAASTAQKYLGWSDSRVVREVEEYRRYVERFRAWHKKSPTG